MHANLLKLTQQSCTSASFEHDIIKDLCRASDLSAACFRLRASAPCTLINMEIEGGEDMVDVGKQLESQAYDPSSQLRSGILTCHTLGLAVRGFLTTPPLQVASRCNQVSVFTFYKYELRHRTRSVTISVRCLRSLFCLLPSFGRPRRTMSCTVISVKLLSLESKMINKKVLVAVKVFCCETELRKDGMRHAKRE